jgi:hypothetical protein
LQQSEANKDFVKTYTLIYGAYVYSMNKAFTTVTIMSLLMTSSIFARDFNFVEGGSLYMKRFRVETLRAEFINASDCELIAKNMRAAEPNVDWYCSTSTEPIILNCHLKNVLIKNTDKKTASTENFNFKISINRGKATTDDLTSAIDSFDSKRSKPYLILTNDYRDVDENYYSRAITTLRLNLDTNELVALDATMNQNGIGNCQK